VKGEKINRGPEWDAYLNSGSGGYAGYPGRGFGYGVAGTTASGQDY